MSTQHWKWLNRINVNTNFYSLIYFGKFSGDFCSVFNMASAIQQRALKKRMRYTAVGYITALNFKLAIFEIWIVIFVLKYQGLKVNRCFDLDLLDPQRFSRCVVWLCRLTMMWSDQIGKVRTLNYANPY